MGTFTVPLAVANDEASRFETFEAWVDTGASYTWIARPTLEALGHTPEDDREFELADGRKITYGVKEIVVRADGRTTTTWVVFGEPGTDALLGAVTLQELGLGVAALNERLIPVPGKLLNGSLGRGR
jgi:aspartyl protease family protein